MLINKQEVTTLILAGGKSSRMGGNDKGLLKIDNEYLIQKIVALALQYSDDVIINVNRNYEIYSALGLKTIKDIHKNFQGPLAGIYSGFLNIKTKYMLILPCDCPMIEQKYFQIMLNSEFIKDIRCAHDGNRLQPVHSLLKKSLINSLKEFLDTGERKIDRWYNKESFEIVDFSEMSQFFLNINTPDDLEKFKIMRESDVR